MPSGSWVSNTPPTDQVNPYRIARRLGGNKRQRTNDVPRAKAQEQHRTHDRLLRVPGNITGDETQNGRKRTGVAADQPEPRQASQLLLGLDELDHQTPSQGDHVQHGNRHAARVLEERRDHDGEDDEEKQERAGRHAEQIGLEDVVAKGFDDDAAELAVRQNV